MQGSQTRHLTPSVSGTTDSLYLMGLGYCEDQMSYCLVTLQAQSGMIRTPVGDHRAQELGAPSSLVHPFIFLLPVPS